MYQRQSTETSWVYLTIVLASSESLRCRPLSRKHCARCLCDNIVCAIMLLQILLLLLSALSTMLCFAMLTIDLNFALKWISACRARFTHTEDNILPFVFCFLFFEIIPVLEKKQKSI